MKLLSPLSKNGRVIPLVKFGKAERHSISGVRVVDGTTCGLPADGRGSSTESSVQVSSLYQVFSLHSFFQNRDPIADAVAAQENGRSRPSIVQ
jgi:hypothetical protein